VSEEDVAGTRPWAAAREAHSDVAEQVKHAVEAAAVGPAVHMARCVSLSLEDVVIAAGTVAVHDPLPYLIETFLAYEARK
jgi:hypothetical protein